MYPFVVRLDARLECLLFSASVYLFVLLLAIWSFP